MSYQQSYLLDLFVRLLLVSLFIFAGVGKITSYTQTQAYMEAFNLPGFLIIPTIAVQLGSAICILAGFGTRYAALILAAFSITTALIFHLDFDDRMQQLMFLKNLAIAGGLLALAQYEHLKLNHKADTE